MIRVLNSTLKKGFSEEFSNWILSAKANNIAKEGLL
jgi:hypothetical protein